MVANDLSVRIRKCLAGIDKKTCSTATLALFDECQSEEFQELLAVCDLRARTVKRSYTTGFGKLIISKQTSHLNFPQFSKETSHLNFPQFSDSDDGWTLGKVTKQSKTYFRVDQETGLLYLKTDGIVNATMLECVGRKLMSYRQLYILIC